ncbi:MAG: response regulator [Blastocatellia bacterium]|nr:response regulator [Blastocatellia bacterium]
MNVPLRVVIADDERPARSFLAAILRGFPDVNIIGEAENGAEALEMIERLNPDLALLDLQMPALDGLTVVRLLKKNRLPLVAFVTAYDEFAVKAFEANAIDYLLKPVEPGRLRETLNRAQERLEDTEWRQEHFTRLQAAVTTCDEPNRQTPVERIPVRQRDEIRLVAVAQIASVVADGELLWLTLESGERYQLTYRLKDLENRLDPTRFIRLGRGVLVRITSIQSLTPMPGGTYLVTLTNGQQLNSSRSQSRILRDALLRF